MTGGQRISAAISRVAANSKPTPYVCRSCRHQLRKASNLNAHRIRQASNTEWTEKIRRKIWGTDNPPGLADPYGPTWADRRRMALEQQEEQERRAKLTEEERVAEDVLEAQSKETQDEPNIVDRELDELFEDDTFAHTEYKPAQTWDGLEHVGHRGHWKDIAPKPEDEYHPWMTPKAWPAWTRQQLVSFLHQAIAESLDKTITPRYFAGKGSSKLTIIQAEDGTLVGVEERKAFTKFENAAVVTEEKVYDKQSEEQDLDNITHGQESTVSAQRLPSTAEAKQPDDEMMDAEVEHIVEEIAASSPTSQAATQPRAPSPPPRAPLDEFFLSAKLDFADPLTFNILKRFQQLTSTRLPDPFLNSLFKSSSYNNSQSTTTAQPPLIRLINYILDLQKPKPKNLYEKLVEKPTLVGQGNLMILPRRETPVDKEKEVGRWKVIERELRERGLPVLGRAVPR